MPLPCGRCIGCRIDRSRQWAVRCIHEASLHQQNSFITLTYDHGHLPPGRSLAPRDLTLFWKKFRKHVDFLYEKKIRYFACGEYGDEGGRPHYHAIVFGHDFMDRKLHSKNNGVPVFTSEELSSIWDLGFSTCGNVTFQSAAYVARYVLKKMTGDPAKKHYESIDEETGEIVDRLPEFVRMSLKPGIAKEWFETYKGDIFPHDYATIGGKMVKTPRYYDKLLKRVDPDGYDEVRAVRREEAKKRASESTPERLAAREAVALSRISKLKRSLT